jgi:hypothetical protein
MFDVCRLEAVLPADTEGIDTFCSYLNYYLKDKVFLCGTIERTNDKGLKISAFWSKDVHMTVMMCFRSAVPSNLALFNSLNGLVTFGKVPKLEPVWIYSASDYSPRVLTWRDDYATHSLEALDIPPYASPSDNISQSTQDAHLVSKNDYKAQGLWLIQKVEPEKAALDWYNKFDTCRIELPHQEHTGYDRLHFYFSWSVIEVDGMFNITLSPMTVHHSNDNDNPPAQHYTLEGIHQADLHTYLRALILRKYLTLIIRRKLNFVDAFKTDWLECPRTAACFNVS